MKQPYERPEIEITEFEIEEITCSTPGGGTIGDYQDLQKQEAMGLNAFMCGFYQDKKDLSEDL